MSEMLRMQFGGLTDMSLVAGDVDFELNGLRLIFHWSWLHGQRHQNLAFAVLSNSFSARTWWTWEWPEKWWTWEWPEIFSQSEYVIQEDASRALDTTNMSKLMDRVISVEYIRDDDELRNGHSPDHGATTGLVEEVEITVDCLVLTVELKGLVQIMVMGPALMADLLEGAIQTWKG